MGFNFYRVLPLIYPKLHRFCACQSCGMKHRSEQEPLTPTTHPHPIRNGFISQYQWSRHHSVDLITHPNYFSSSHPRHLKFNPHSFNIYLCKIPISSWDASRQYQMNRTHINWHTKMIFASLLIQRPWISTSIFFVSSSNCLYPGNLIVKVSVTRVMV